MSPRTRRRSDASRRILAVILALVALGAGLVACAGPEFDPTGACTVDGKQPGAYPEMEALVPKRYDGTAPSQLDSGRTCTTAGLGSLASHGVTELRFAGATWQTGSQSGLTLATFSSVGGPTLDPAWLSEFYETTAQSGKNIQSIDTSTVALPSGGSADRLDVLNDESYQTVVVWKAGDRVIAVLVGDFIREVQSKDAHEKIVQGAISAALGG